ncbi:glycerate kinase, partial [bacterium]|nr:glycerate kinase [bacterium]
MKIILAPDSFKDSLSAVAVCEAMETGARRVLPDAEIVRLPLADGGEGTIDALAAAGACERVTLTVTDPLSGTVRSEYGVLKRGKTAVIEMASASGLQRVPAGLRNPLHTTTFGTGELIRHSLLSGFRDIVVTTGGSATSDCGSGAVQALGVRFMDGSGREIRSPMTGADMMRVGAVDLSGLPPAVAESRFRVATDVTNPLLGPDGAVAVYAGQKGASGADLEILEQGMANCIDILEAACGLRVRDIPGAGSAGGIAAGLMAVAKAEAVPGIEWVLDACRFRDHLSRADLILTGEGRLDRQTASGKLVHGVARAGGHAGVPVLAVAGRVDLDEDQAAAAGLSGAYAASDASMPLSKAMRNAAGLVADAAERAVREFVGS